MNFKDKRYLIVGASSGIGRSLSFALAEEGAKLVIVARNSARLEVLIKEFPGNGHEFLAADACDPDQLKPLIQMAKNGGEFSGAVCCAGIHEIAPLTVLKPDAIRCHMEGNLLTAINMTKTFIRCASKDGASVVWISSIAAFEGTPGFLAYSASKGALISAAKVTAAELASRKIRVNVVAGGVIETPMSQGWIGKLNDAQKEEINKKHLLGIGTPDDIVGPIEFLLSDKSGWMTGSVLTADGGLSV